MGVTLERVQNKFACIIGELCNEPYVLSKFAIWVDLRIAEYKANGAISLDCTGDNPNPLWLKGMGLPQTQKTEPHGRDEDLMPSRNTPHNRKDFEGRGFLSSPRSLHLTSDPNETLSQNLNSTEDDLIQIKTEPSDVYPMNLHLNSDFNRKRKSEDRDVRNSDNSIFPSAKSRSFCSATNISNSGEETESFLSVIGVSDQPSTSHALDSDNFDQGIHVNRISGDFNSSRAGNIDDSLLIDQDTSSTHLPQNSSFNQQENSKEPGIDLYHIFNQLKSNNSANNIYTGEERAMIGKHALQHSSKETAKYFTQQLMKNITDNTVRFFRRRLLATAKIKNCSAEDIVYF